MESNGGKVIDNVRSSRVDKHIQDYRNIRTISICGGLKLWRS